MSVLLFGIQSEIIGATQFLRYKKLKKRVAGRLHGKTALRHLSAHFPIIRKALPEQELCVFTEEYAVELCKTENFQNLLKNSRIYATIKLPETFSVI